MSRLLRTHQIETAACHRCRHASTKPSTGACCPAHLPHAEAPLRVQQRHLVLHQLPEAAPDERALLGDAAVEGDRLRVGAQARMQLPIRACTGRQGSGKRVMPVLVGDMRIEAARALSLKSEGRMLRMCCLLSASS